MIFTVANQKGGQNKTTTATAIVTGATYKGKSALAIDLDYQASLSFIMGGDLSGKGAYEIITGQANAEDVIQNTQQGDLITASDQLAGADTTLTGRSRIYGIMDALDGLKQRYDVIVIDTPPTLGTMLINALTAADSVIIPIQADILALNGLNMLLQTITQTKEQFNNRLDVAGILLTQYSNRTIISRDLFETIQEQADALQVPVFHTTIRSGVAVRESQTVRESLFTYSPKSNPAKDYLSFLEEIGL